MDRTKPVRVAISGKSGCGNSTVSALLAERLGVSLINYTFHTMADEEGISFEEMCRRAESDDTWDRHLDTQQVERAMAGSCVLGSRLAVWLLDRADLRVYLTASPAVRAQRIQRREGGRIDDVIARTDARDARDHARYLRLYDIDTSVFDFVDMVVDTEVAQPAQIVESILAEMTRRGILP